MKKATVENTAKTTRFRRFSSQFALITLFLAGILVALYPFYINALNSFIDDYRVEQAEKRLLANQERLAKKATENETRARQGLDLSTDPFDEAGGSSGKDAAYFREHLLGKVSIPAIEVEIPLYDTTNQALLDRGATVLQGSSFPTGGADTHSLISAHSGLPDRKLFTDLEDLKVGDEFLLEVYGKKLAYKVDRIDTVLPTETSSLKIEKGQDLVTLITCTPYMVNSHRLLVRGHRIPFTEKLAKAVTASKEKNRWKQRGILALTVLIVGWILFLLGRTIYRFFLSRNRYELVLRRLDLSGRPVVGEEYVLLDHSGRRSLKRNGHFLWVKTDQNGLLWFRDLPGGIYTLKPVGGDKKLQLKVGTKQPNQAKMLLYPKKKQRHWIINQRIIKR